jgi:hypothetical protein
MEYIAYQIAKGYILINGAEKYLIHQSIKSTDPKKNKKYSPFYLKDLNLNKHITGLFTTGTQENPIFTYYTNDERIDIQIIKTIAIKTIKPKKKKTEIINVQK